MYVWVSVTGNVFAITSITPMNFIPTIDTHTKLKQQLIIAHISKFPFRWCTSYALQVCLNIQNVTNNTPTINKIHLLCLMKSDHTNEHGSSVVVGRRRSANIFRLRFSFTLQIRSPNNIIFVYTMKALISIYRLMRNFSNGQSLADSNLW